MSAAVAVISEDGQMSSSSLGPRAGGPRIRRAFTDRQKLEFLAGYDAAVADGTGGGEYLRSNGLYSSLISEWRRLHDGGALTQKRASKRRSDRLSPEQAEIARLTRDLDLAHRRLAKTEAALDIMGKARALLDEISESADTELRPFRR